MKFRLTVSPDGLTLRGLREDRRVRLLPLMERRVGRLWPALVVVLMMGAACTGAGEVESPGRATGASSVRNVSSIAAIRDQFNHDTGKVRLILLISPT